MLKAAMDVDPETACSATALHQLTLPLGHQHQHMSLSAPSAANPTLTSHTVVVGAPAQQRADGRGPGVIGAAQHVSGARDEHGTPDGRHTEAAAQYPAPPGTPQQHNMTIEQVSVSVGAPCMSKPPESAADATEEVIVVDVDLSVPAGDTTIRPWRQRALSTIDLPPGSDELNFRGRRPTLPPMESFRGGVRQDEVTLTPVTLPERRSTGDYDVIMSSYLRNHVPLVQLNTADLEVLPVPVASHAGAPLDVSPFVNTDSSDSISTLADKLVSPHKQELLGGALFPAALPPPPPPPTPPPPPPPPQPPLSLSLSTEARSPPAEVAPPPPPAAAKLPPPYSQPHKIVPRPAAARAAPPISRLTTLCQQLTETIKARKCGLCSFISLQERDVADHLLETHRSELDRMLGTSTSRRSRPQPPTRVVSTTPEVQCLVNVHGRLSIEPRPIVLPDAVVSSESGVQTRTAGGAASSGSETERRQRPAGAVRSPPPAIVEVLWMGGGGGGTPVATTAPKEAAISQSRRVLNQVAALKPTQLRQALVPKKKGRPRDARTLGLSVLGKGARVERVLGLFRCEAPNCGLRLRDRAKLQVHERCHVPERPGDWRCPECGHEESRWRSMSLHLWRTHQIDCDLYHCDICDYKTTRYSQLVNQHRPTHGFMREHVCDTCNKGFKNSKQLQNHRAKHRNREDPAFIESCRCDVCDAVLSDRRSLQLHKDMVHEKRRSHQCVTCGRVFSCRSSLVMHARQHSGQKQFECGVCDYATTDHNTLRRHKMRHTGERPYKCPHCNYSCIQSTTYKKHVRTKHPGEADDLVFSCPHCMFKTIQRSAYTRHVREHDEPTPAAAAPAPPSVADQQHVVRVHETMVPADSLLSSEALLSEPLLPPAGAARRVRPASGGELAPPHRPPLKIASTVDAVYQLVPANQGGQPSVLSPQPVQLVCQSAEPGKTKTSRARPTASSSRKLVQ